MRTHSAWIVMGLLLSACASTSSISELGQNAKSVTYLQHGIKPLKNKIGNVNAKTQTAGMMAGGVLALTVQDAVSDPERKFMESLLSNRPLTSEIAAGVMPLLASAMNQRYEPGQAMVVPAQAKLAQDGIFTWLDPKTDLVVVFSVETLELTQRLTSLTDALKPSVALSFNDKEVAPNIFSTMTVYKRDPGTQKLKQAWQEQCRATVLSMPVGRKFAALQANPGLAKGMFDAAVPVAIDSCKQKLPLPAQS